jgi:hypothetical protein
MVGVFVSHVAFRISGQDFHFSFARMAAKSFSAVIFPMQKGRAPFCEHQQQRQQTLFHLEECKYKLKCLQYTVHNVGIPRICIQCSLNTRILNF